MIEPTKEGGFGWALGPLIAVASGIVGLIAWMLGKAYLAGRYSKDFETIHAALAEIKVTLDKQDVAFQTKVAADSVADGIILVMQHRLLALEERIKVVGERTHRIPSLESALTLATKEVSNLSEEISTLREKLSER